MSDSGARGNISNFTQLVGMRGLMSNPKGETIELPIKSALREGLTASEFFISTHGARKGSTDTALKTADSGYLTRRLVDVAQEVIITEDDCHTDKGFEVSELINTADGNVIVPLVDRLVGRTSLKDICDPATGEIIVHANELMTEKSAKAVADAGIKTVEIRNIFGCKSKTGICRKCYGLNLATGQEVLLGETIGIMGAQSIGEPGTQLTMRTFHTGGVAGGDITQGLPRVEELFEARKPKGVAIISEIAGKVKIKETKKKKEVIVTSKDDSRTYTIPFGSKMKVKDGDMVEVADPLIEGSINPGEILELKGPEGVYEYLTSEVQKVYRNQGVDINDKHVEVIGRQMLKKVRVEDNGDTDMFPGSLIDMYEFEDKNNEAIAEGKRPATGRRVLLGITKASLATESFLSAASFQETTRVLTEAAIKGKTDDLVGLKENVIIGKLIPAGTGMKRYLNTHIDTEKKLEEVADVEE